MHIPDDPQQFTTLVQQLTQAQLSQLHHDLTFKITKLHVQLDCDTRPKTDPWYIKAKTALKYTQWRLEIVVSETSLRKRQEFLRIKQCYDSQFVEAAKQLLPQTQFAVLHTEASELCNSKSS